MRFSWHSLSTTSCSCRLLGRDCGEIYPTSSLPLRISDELVVPAHAHLNTYHTCHQAQRERHNGRVLCDI